MPETNKELPEDEIGPEDDENTPVEGKKGLSRLVVILLPLILIPAAVGAYLAYSQYTTLAQAAVAVGLDYGVVPEAATDKPIEYGQFTTINDLLINPAGSGGKRFLVVSLGVETQSSSVLVELEQKEVVVRDAILRLLSQRTDEELSAIELRGPIKEEILVELNSILQKGKIDRLYFTQYLLQ